MRIQFSKFFSSTYNPLPQPRYSSDDPASEQFLEGPNSKLATNSRGRWGTTAAVIVPWILNGLLCIALVHSIISHNPPFSEETYSPAQHIITPQNVVFTSGFGTKKSIYQGPNTPERDKAWEDLYDFGISRIPASAAGKLVNKTVPISRDPDYYVVELDVFHQLHCLNMIRKRLWSNETFSADHELMGIEHLSHCIDSLRQSLMCSSDISPLTWVWDEKAKEAKEIMEVQHTCRDFGKIQEWARENMVGVFDRTVFVEDKLKMETRG
ncbi:hypothetical protein BDD12DRAFT_866480 [Trichophaea hybrida]|nr:hypothetical protein BDD12DRAFT_866480 [Trichophaea hybrida]